MSPRRTQGDIQQGAKTRRKPSSFHHRSITFRKAETQFVASMSQVQLSPLPVVAVLQGVANFKYPYNTWIQMATIGVDYGFSWSTKPSWATHRNLTGSAPGPAMGATTGRLQGPNLEVSAAMLCLLCASAGQNSMCTLWNVFFFNRFEYFDCMCTSANIWDIWNILYGQRHFETCPSAFACQPSFHPQQQTKSPATPQLKISVPLFVWSHRIAVCLDSRDVLEFNGWWSWQSFSHQNHQNCINPILLLRTTSNPSYPSYPSYPLSVLWIHISLAYPLGSAVFAGPLPLRSGSGPGSACCKWLLIVVSHGLKGNNMSM